MRKRHAAQRDAQAVHIGEVGLRRFARLVDLGKDHLAARDRTEPATPRSADAACATDSPGSDQGAVPSAARTASCPAGPDRARAGWRSTASPRRTDWPGCDRCAALEIGWAACRVARTDATSARSCQHAPPLALEFDLWRARAASAVPPSRASCRSLRLEAQYSTAPQFAASGGCLIDMTRQF